MEAVRVDSRYDLPNEKGLTKRELNKRFGKETPEATVPVAGRYLWELFNDLKVSIPRRAEGYYHLIPPTEYLAFFKLKGLLISPWEYDTLKSMDLVFCNERNLEENAARERRQAEINEKAKK